MPSLHHLALSATDLAKSGPFYDAVLNLLGYRPGSTGDALRTWIGPDSAPEILLWAAEGDDRSRHTHGRPGWQHAAMHVDDRATVDAVHAAVLAGGWTVVHAPREYPGYADDYYAVFITDPDGIRWEIAHIPTPVH